MNRRSFLKLAALSPLLGIFGCKKAVSCPSKMTDDEFTEGVVKGFADKTFPDGEFGTTHSVRWVGDGKPNRKIAFQMKSQTIPFTEGEVPAMDTFYFDDIMNKPIMIKHPGDEYHRPATKADIDNTVDLLEANKALKRNDFIDWNEAKKCLKT